MTCTEVVPPISEIKERLVTVHERVDRIASSLAEKDIDILNELKTVLNKITDVGKLVSAYHLSRLLMPYTNNCDEIFNAIRELGSKRTGALIVIDREENIEEWITEGTSLNAEISSSLLDSIFHVGSPLHDGAVWIHKDMIVSAANILPLTRKTYRNMKLGTRHRAAIGLSERTDALIFVVSEETGKESFAFNGILYPFRSSSMMSRMTVT